MATLPLTMATKQATEEIANAINNAIRTYQLPMFLVERILKDFYMEASNAAGEEFARAKESYETEIAKEQTQTASENVG